MRPRRRGPDSGKVLAFTEPVMLTGPEKAVVFLLSLNEDIAAPIVNELSEADLRKLRSVASTMREVGSTAVDEAYRDFLERSSKQIAVPRGGLSYLRRLAAGALGESKAKELFEDGVHSPLARLEAAPPDVVAALLENEPPQLVGAILARLEPRTAALVLMGMSVERQSAVLARVGRMTELPAGALEDIANALAGELPDTGTEALVSIDGIARAAAMLNAATKDNSNNVLQMLDVEEPELAQGLRLAMFTFEDLQRVDPRNMRTLLREVPTERLTIALKNASDQVKAAIFAGLSQRASELIKDDLEVLGNIRKAEIDKARVEILQIALRLEGEGTLDLGRGGE